MFSVNKQCLIGLLSISCGAISSQAMAQTYSNGYYHPYDDNHQYHQSVYDENRHYQRSDRYDDYYSSNGYSHPYGDQHVRKIHTKRHKNKQRAKKREPVPETIAAPGNKIVNVSLSNLTWAAYSPDGTLVKSGPISGGKDYCPDIGKSCRTPTGTYTFYSKKGAGCKSSKFPVGKGGAKMPYCMHFKGGFAMHGSNAVPGYHASHGCIRMLVDDARWLNQEFVNIGSTRVKITN